MYSINNQFVAICAGIIFFIVIVTSPLRVKLVLKKAGEMYLGVELDKSVRGKIIYLGLTPETIAYSANDVKYLEDIKNCQEKLLKEKGLMLAMSYSNKFILALAYMEFCGVKVDINK